MLLMHCKHKNCNGLIMHLFLLQVVAVYGTLSDLLSVASNKLGIRACNLYNGKGGLIDDIALIRCVAFAFFNYFLFMKDNVGNIIEKCIANLSCFEFYDYRQPCT